MALPFYISPEQFVRDKSDFARKNIAKGKPVVAMDYVDGILFVAENPSATLYKISEIYDRVAFAAAGNYNEFEALRMHGIRQADMQGYAYSREDVSAGGLAKSFSQILGQIFAAELKPYEVEILIAEVGEGGQPNHLFHILYDGSPIDETNFVAMGGQAEKLTEFLKQNFQTGLSLGDAMKLGLQALAQAVAEDGKETVPPERLEVAVLDRNRERRKFQRMTDEAIKALSS
jgi:proteasome alpha subunit